MQEPVFETPVLLTPSDPPPVETLNRQGRADLLLVCDHAHPRVPTRLMSLGLDADVLGCHIAYDIGAYAVACQLSRRLDACLVSAGYSRLVIDPNRPPGHPDSIVTGNDGIAIAGNQSLDPLRSEARLHEIFEPYHTRIGREIARLWTRARPPVLFSIHSFNPRFGHQPRPWDVGILWGHDGRLAKPLIAALAACGLEVGDNEPYSGRSLAYSMDRHAAASGLAHCTVEINQERLGDDAEADRWADVLATALTEILNADGLHTIAGVQG